MKVEIQFSGPAVPVWPSHGPDGTRPSSDTSPATAVVVAVASAPDGRREDEGCVVDVYDAHKVMAAHVDRSSPFANGA